MRVRFIPCAHLAGQRSLITRRRVRSAHVLRVGRFSASIARGARGVSSVELNHGSFGWHFSVTLLRGSCHSRLARSWTIEYGRPGPHPAMWEPDYVWHGHRLQWIVD